LSSNVRIPVELYQALQKIRLSLESQYFTAAPTVQDMISVAIQRFIRDWNNPEQQSQLFEELLEHRKTARSRMGKKTSKNTE